MTADERVVAPDWVAELEVAAPDVIAVWRLIDIDNDAARDELEARSSRLGAAAILAQQEVVAEALEDVLGRHARGDAPCPRRRGGLERLPGVRAHHRRPALPPRRGSDGRLGPLAGRRSAAGDPRRPRAPPTSTATMLMTYLAKSRRSQALAASAISGHEADPCPMDHPLIGHRLSCGAWLLFAGVHDAMHLEQLHGLLDSAGA